MYIGPVQFNRPGKAIASMTIEDRILAGWYLFSFVVLVLCSTDLKPFPVLLALDGLVFLLFLNRLGLWCM